MCIVSAECLIYAYIVHHDTLALKSFMISCWLHAIGSVSLQIPVARQPEKSNLPGHGNFELIYVFKSYTS